MGLMNALGAGFEVASKVGGESAQHYLTSQIEADRQARLLELQSSYRTTEKIAEEDRAVARADTERTRQDAKAGALAAERAAPQISSGRAALEAADAAGTLPEGVLREGLMGLGSYKPVPTYGERLLAEGKTTEAARLAESDEAQTRQAGRDKVADDKDARDLKLREKQETRLAGVAADDARLKKIQIGQAEEVETWRKKMTDKNLPEAERKEAKEMYQALSGKDADKWSIVKGKDTLGNEVIFGRQNDKTGAYEKFDGTGFVSAGAPGEAQPVEFNGVVIGKATTKAEADKLIAEAKTKKSTGGSGGEGGSNNLVSNARQYKSLSEKLRALEASVETSPNRQASERRINEIKQELRSKFDGWSDEKAADILGAVASNFAPRPQRSMMGAAAE